MDIESLIVEFISSGSHAERIKALQETIEDASPKEVFLFTTELISQKQDHSTVLALFQLIDWSLSRIKAKNYSSFVDTALSAITTQIQTKIKSQQSSLSKVEQQQFANNDTFSVSVSGNTQSLKDYEDVAVSDDILELLSAGLDLSVQLFDKITELKDLSPLARLLNLLEISLTCSNLNDDIQNALLAIVQRCISNTSISTKLFDTTETDLLFEDYDIDQGLACILYLLTVVEIGDYLPSPLSPNHLFKICLSNSIHLLRKSKLATKGIMMLQTATTYLPPFSISLEIASPDELFYQSFFESLIQFMANCPVQQLRSATFKVFTSLFQFFDEQSRFHLLSHIIEFCPYTSVSSLTLFIMKQETERVLNSNDPELLKKSPFVGENILEIIKMLLLPSKILERFEVILASLNYYRFLLIKSRQVNAASVSEPKQLTTMRKEFLQPLQKDIDDEIAALSDLSKQGEAIEQTKHYFGLSGVANEDLAAANNSNITSLQLLKDTIQRIGELMKGASPFSGAPDIK